MKEQTQKRLPIILHIFLTVVLASIVYIGTIVILFVSPVLDLTLNGNSFYSPTITPSLALLLVVGFNITWIILVNKLGLIKDRLIKTYVIVLVLAISLSFLTICVVPFGPPP